MLSKLHQRLSVYIILFSLLVVVFTSVLLYKITYDDEQKESLSTIQNLTSTIYNSASMAAYLDNKAIADEVSKGALHSPLIEGVEIITPNMHMSAGHMEKNNKPHVIITTLYSPFSGKEKVGELLIYPNQHAIENYAQKTAVLFAKEIFIILSTLILFITLIVWLVIGRPLNHLTHTLAKLDPVSSKKRLIIPDIVKNSEIDFFAFTVNELLDRVQQQLHEERKLREQMALIAQNFQMTFELSNNAVVITDPELRMKYFNPAFERLLNSSVGAENYYHEEKWIEYLVKNPDDFVNKINELLQNTNDKSIDIKINTLEQKRNRWMNVTAVQAVNTDNEPIIMIFFNDITRQLEALSASETAASYDHLTRLKNRRLAEQEISLMIQQAIDQKQSMAILLIDLDGFKFVNDTQGHDAGDKVLIAVANRLKALTRKSDTVARWGGDEFIVALDRIGATDVIQLSQKFLHALNEPITLGEGKTARVGASIGIVLCPHDASDFNEAFDKADSAMYQIKQAGKHGFQLYSD